ncbi:esterase-like activity of phytase family protein [Actinoplanes sp. KI2]|uniref:esterase-like activity of phytase family protein n=1 Tax=Actinoplanes sp. KI2 TaxID=2983315 RepID=UPI0021D59435|nr:esterase-like activity of phytase family protein [Actinoplanes sp. KI2]MCU7727479.1 esterase-like activity of phytase family protein [Actinoplanes sp. KI2]
MHLDHFRARRRATVIGGTAAVIVLASVGTAWADPFGWWVAKPHPFAVTADIVGVAGNVLANDYGATAVVRHTGLDTPSAGGLVVHADGSYTFTPAVPGSHGTVHFGYTATDAVTVYPGAVPGGDQIPPLGGLEGPNGSTVQISGGGYGSSFVAVPGRPGWFAGVTDRGPNADDDGPTGQKAFADPTFNPKIGLFRLVGGKAVVQRTIALKAPDGTPYNGLPNPVTKTAASAEKTEDLYGTYLDPAQPYPVPGSSPAVTLDPRNGYDSEGLVALADGSFWVSDEYGPFITHFDRNGTEIERLSPWGADAGHHVDTAHPLPAELTLRTKNKGMEGLTVTPDGRTLVGIMQSALSVPDYGTDAKGKTVKPGNVSPVRIVTVDLRTKTIHEYVYLLTNPATTSGAVSEITALSATKFLVDERDGLQGEPGQAAVKNLYEIDLTGATDVTGSGGPLGYTVGGRSIDAYVGDAPTAKAGLLLSQAGIVPVSKTPYLELGTVLNQLDPSGAFFGHDKIEGITAADGGRVLYLANDSDFGIDHLLGQNEAACEASGLSDTTACTPVRSATTGRFLLHQKTLDAAGVVDDGEVLRVDMSRLPVVLGSATVTIRY